jgi:hypothetical protein
MHIPMLLDALAAVLPPPAQPRETGSTAAWGAVHARLGVVLPEDYIQFIKRYGTGVVAGWLTVLNPFAKDEHLNLLHAGFEFLGALRELKSEYPETVPFPLHYEPDGLLPWGVSIDGDIFCWRTTGLSGHWTTVVIGRHTDPEAFPLAFSPFLRGILTNELETLACPRDLPRTFEGMS